MLTHLFLYPYFWFWTSESFSQTPPSIPNVSREWEELRILTSHSEQWPTARFLWLKLLPRFPALWLEPCSVLCERIFISLYNPSRDSGKLKAIQSEIPSSPAACGTEQAGCHELVYRVHRPALGVRKRRSKQCGCVRFPPVSAAFSAVNDHPLWHSHTCVFSWWI